MDNGNAQKRASLTLKKEKLDRVRKHFEQSKKRLETEKLTLMSLAERTAELDRVQCENEEELTAARKDSAAHKDLLMRTRLELKTLDDKKVLLDAETSGARTQNKVLARKIVSLDEKVMKQQENLYEFEFQIQGLERKVSRAGGARSDEETRVLQNKLDSLQLTLNDRVAEKDLLVASARRAEEDLESARKKSKLLKMTSNKLTENINELTLEAELTSKDVRKAVVEKEDKMVAHDTLKLEVKKLRDALEVKADQVFELENRKQQLLLSMEERKHEIETHGELLKAQLKMIGEDVHRATLEMRERAMKVGKLQAKFEVLVHKVKRPGGDGDENDGEERSQAYYVVKAAQEREDMQRKGDALDHSIRTQEKECAALEVTLRKLTKQNDSFRVSNRPCDNSDTDELTKRAALQEKLESVTLTLSMRKEEEAKMELALQKRDKNLQRMHDEAGTINLELDVLEKEAGESEMRLRDTAQRAETTHGLLLDAQDRYRLKKGLPADESAQGELGAEELDMRCEELKEGTRVVVSELKQVAAKHPELATLLASYGVKLPGIAIDG